MQITKFMESVIEQFTFSAEDAKRIERIYTKEKLFKYDVVAGGFTMKHGVFWERKPMEQAVKIAKRDERENKAWEKEVQTSLKNQENY